MKITPRFYLKRSASVTPTGIQLVLRFNRQILKYGTGKSILPVLWDNDTQRPTTNRYQIKKHKADKVDLENIKIRLDNIELEVKRIFQYLERQKINPYPELIRKELDEVFQEELSKSNTNNNLTGYIQSFINEMEEGTRLIPSTGKRYSNGTIKNYKGFLSQLHDFEKKKRRKLKFENITTDFYDTFIQFFNSKNYSPNTIGRHIKNLKTIMRITRDEGLHENNEFERKQFKTLRVDSPSIYLKEKELAKMEALDLSDNANLQIARDVFLVGCYTAQRFSDFSRIGKQHFHKTSKGNDIVKLIQKKTGIEIQIPVSPKLRFILEKYDYQLPKIYEQKLNQRIKEVGKLADIDTMELVEEIKGGLTIKKQIPKFELIKTHTARRTGATNMYLAGISAIDIMKITGHKTEKNLLKYIKVTKEQTADILANHAYFNQTPLKVAR
jgi:integrase